MTDFRGSFTEAQRAILLEPVRPHRVSKDSKGLSHMEGFEITAHLNRIFGFEGWDKEILDQWVIFEHSEVKKTGDRERTGWWVCYGCRLRLTVRSTDGVVVTIKEESATGASENQPSRGDAHDLAIKTSTTYALKRCAKDLGDQFGLSLYDKGSVQPLVRRVIPYEAPPLVVGGEGAESDEPAEFDWSQRII